MKNSLNNIIFIIALFILSSCNPDKYFGYSNEAEVLIESVKIKGQVVNLYNDEPAPIVHVSAGPYETLTDYTGAFFINYILTPDDERNRPVRFLFTHEKYYDEERRLVIDPLGMEINVAMRYAAPIIKEAALFPNNDASELEGRHYICQAIIMDYQGILTVGRVEVRYNIEDSAGNIRSAATPLTRVATVSDREGHFQAEISIGSTEGIQNGYQIYAQDDEGFDDLYKTSKNPLQPDDPIF